MPTDAVTSRSGGRRRRRTALGLSILVVVGLGLFVHGSSDKPAADFVADALYAVCLYLLVAFIVPRARPLLVALTALAACVAIELFQLTGVPAALSNLGPARLLLGTTFSALDLVAYALGVLVALACDHGVHHAWPRQADAAGA